MLVRAASTRERWRVWAACVSTWPSRSWSTTTWCASSSGSGPELVDHSARVPCPLSNSIESNQTPRSTRPDPIQSESSVSRSAPSAYFFFVYILILLSVNILFSEFLYLNFILEQMQIFMHCIALHSTFASLRSAHSPELNAPRRNAVVCSSCDPMTMSYCTINCVIVSVIVALSAR